MAPITEQIKPAVWPSLYQCRVRPTNPAKNEPAMPSKIVIKKPPGSFPGIRSLATIPMKRPIIIVQSIVIINKPASGGSAFC